MEQELKACPFCDGHCTLTLAGFGQPEWLYYCCDRCGASSGACANKELAIAAWNTRVGEQQVSALTAELESARASEKRLREALEEAENKLRAHDGLIALKNGIPEATGDPVFDEVLRIYPVAEMIQRQWLSGVTGFDDPSSLRKALIRFFDAIDLADLLSGQSFQRSFTPRAALASPRQEP